MMKTGDAYTETELHMDLVETLNYTDILDTGTTNNITGVFDIKSFAGGPYYYVATNISSTSNFDDKYLDCYDEDTFTFEQSYGDAMYEVSGVVTAGSCDEEEEESNRSWDYGSQESDYSYSNVLVRVGEFTATNVTSPDNLSQFRPVIIVY